MENCKILRQQVKKNHHYLPIVYSKQWQDSNGMLHIHAKGTSRKSKPEKCFFEKNLNTLEPISDLQLSIIESIYGNFLESNNGKEAREFIYKLYETSKTLEILIKEKTIDIHYYSFKRKFYLEEKYLDDFKKIINVLLSNTIEDYFSDIESRYGKFIIDLIRKDEKEKVFETVFFKFDVFALLCFSTLQYFRSKRFRLKKESKLKYTKALFNLTEKEIKNIVILSSYIEHKMFLYSLSESEISLLKNSSEVNFFTSDNPFFECRNELNQMGIDADYIFPISPLYLATFKFISNKKRDITNCDICYGKLKKDIDFINKINEIIRQHIYKELITLDL